MAAEPAAAAAAPPLVAMQEIGKAFPGVQALDGVSFDVLAGEVHALVGENGAGKSTLMKILSGNLQPDGGRLLLNGRAVRFADPGAAIAAGIGTIHQELTIIPHLSIAENIFLGRLPVDRLGMVSRRRLRQAAADLLQPLGLHEDPARRAGDLPIGLQQLVEVAKSLGRNAAVLIMDEPTSSLSDEDSHRLWGIVRRLRDEGRGIVFISHKIEEVLRIADRVTVLRDGRHIATLPRAGLTADKVVALMVGREVHWDTPTPAPVGEATLAAQGLTRDGVFEDVSFTVRAGEVVGMAGLVGAGRTEVVRAVFGADPLDAGVMRLGGRPFRPRHPREAIAAGIGFVPENRKEQALILEMSIAENIVLPATERRARLGLLDDAGERKVAAEYAAQVDVRSASLDRNVVELSGGNQQKVVLARWLAMQPRLLIVDEPTRGIDVGAKTEVHALLRRLAASGVAVLVVSSELAEILALSDRVLVMREGRLVADLPAAGLTESDLGRHAIGVAGAA